MSSTKDAPIDEQSSEIAQPSRRSLFQSTCIVLACTLAMIVNSTNNAGVSVALPVIQHEFQLIEVNVQWVVSAYPLSSGCLLLLFGRLADLYGRKKAFVLGSIWLVAFTIGCSFADEVITLDILRGFQGVGAAATIPASLGILAHSFPPSRARSIAFATFAAGAPLGGAFGSVIGGVLTEYSPQTWRATFYLSAGLTALSLVAGLYSIPRDEPSTEEDKRVDWIGAILVTVGLVLVVFVLSQGEIAPTGRSSAYIIALLVIGVVFVVLFVFWEGHLERTRERSTESSYAPPPVMSLSLWTRAKGRVAVIFWIAFLNFSCFIAWTYWIQLYYQNYMRLSPVEAATRLIPMFVTGLLCNAFVAIAASHVPLIYLLAIGTALTAFSSLLLAVINPSAPYWAFGFPSSILSVLGADFVFAAGTLFVARESRPHEQSLAGGVFQTMTQIGSSLGVTVSTVVFDQISRRRDPRFDALGAYHAAGWTCFSFGILASVLSVISSGIRVWWATGGTRHQDPKKPWRRRRHVAAPRETFLQVYHPRKTNQHDPCRLSVPIQHNYRDKADL